MSIQVRNGVVVAVTAAPSRRLALFEGWIALLFAVVSVLAVARWENPDAGAWAGALVSFLFSAAFAVYGGWKLVEVARGLPAVALRMDEAGILLPRAGGLVLPWAAIEGAHLELPGSFLPRHPFDLLLTERLHLELRAGPELDRRVPGGRALRARRSRRDGRLELRLSLDRLSVTGRTLLECVEGHLRRLRRQPA